MGERLFKRYQFIRYHNNTTWDLLLILFPFTVPFLIKLQPLPIHSILNMMGYQLLYVENISTWGNQLTLDPFADSYTQTSIGQLKQRDEFRTFNTRILRIVSVFGIGPSQSEFIFSCSITKKGEFAAHTRELGQLMSQARYDMSSLVIVQSQKQQLVLERFLNGRGGSRVPFLAGILINWILLWSSRIFKQLMFGISHLLTMGKKIGTAFSSCIERVPSMVVFSLQDGIFTATLNSALSFFLILKWTSSQYSYRQLLLTEQTYQSRSLNSLL